MTLTAADANFLRRMANADRILVPGEGGAKTVGDLAGTKVGQALIKRGMFRMTSWTQGHLTDAGVKALESAPVDGADDNGAQADFMSFLGV